MDIQNIPFKVTVDKYSFIFPDVNTLILRNKLTKYTIIVPLTEKPDKNIFDLIDKSIRMGLSLIIDEEEINEYFQKAGMIEYGIEYDANIITKIREGAINEYAKIHYEKMILIKTPEEIAKEVTYNYNETHFQDASSKKPNFNQLMKSALNNLFENNIVGQKVYEFLVTLDLERYKVTRQILIPANLDFYSFHEILISIFDWWNYHLAEFEFSNKAPNEIFWFPREFNLSMWPEEDRTTNYMDDYILDELIEKYPFIFWTYDFGDNWIHQIELLKIHENFVGEAPYLVKAEYNRPPEDVGGVGRFNEFLDIINNPEHEDYKNFNDWKGNWKPNLTKKQSRPKRIVYSTDDNPRYSGPDFY